MDRYYIVRDGKIECSTDSKKSAHDIIKGYQEIEMRRRMGMFFPPELPKFNIIKGTMEFVKYE